MSDEIKKRTEVVDVEGFTFDIKTDTPARMRKKKITVRITKDEKGKTLSLADELRGIMLLIPMEPIEDLLWWVMADD